MIEIKLNNNTTILEEFKVERTYSWDESIQKNVRMHKTYIKMFDITRAESNEIKEQIQNSNPTKGFGRFEFEGSVSFNINNFYVTLYNVSITNFSYHTNQNTLKINFTPLDGFGYLSGMGLNVLRDQKLSQVLNF